MIYLSFYLTTTPTHLKHTVNKKHIILVFTGIILE